MGDHFAPQHIKASMSVRIDRACTACGAANPKGLQRCEAVLPGGRVCGVLTPPPEFIDAGDIGEPGQVNEQSLLAQFYRFIGRHRP